METEKYQKELFEFEAPKKAAARFGKMFPRTDLAITLTPEKMVFAAIGIIMLMVIFFALGVEKGRSAAYTKFTATKAVPKDIIAVPAISAKPAQSPIAVTKGAIATNVKAKISPSAVVKPQAIAVKPQAVFDKTKPYMIVAAAFSKEDLALKEVSKLKAAGLGAFIYYGEPYYLACVGSFQNKDGAQKILNKVRQMHRDAYVRLR